MNRLSYQPSIGRDINQRDLLMTNNPQKSSLTILKENSKSIVAVLLAVLGLIIIFQNTETVETKLLWITISMPRAALLAVTFALGSLSGILFSLRRTRK
jgi:uncharacterized integral membrane protein